jgi:mycothiol maleylpyruvate isomerase-like protein
MDREELLRVEGERWGEFRALLDRIPLDRMDEPSLNADGWSVRDLVWHMRCWNSVVADELEKIHAGTFEHFDWNTEENNARFLAEGRDVDLATVRAALASSRDRGRRAMTNLKEVSPKAEELFSESAFKHMDDHLPELRGFVQNIG